LKVKRKKPNWYSIFIVPEGRPASKGVKIPNWAPKFVCVFAALWLLATIIFAATALYYRNGWLATENIRVTADEINSKRIEIDEELAQMRQMVGNADRLASRLETAIGINKRIMKKGIGPVSEEEELPNAGRLKIPSGYDLSASNGEVDSKVAFSDLELKMDKLNETVSSVEMRLQQVYEFQKGKLAYWASIPSIWPCRGWVTSEFGVRRSPRGIGTRFHEGIDIAAGIGTPIYASGDGVVTFAGYKHGMGKTVIIDHGFGISSIYGHGSQIYVKAGDRVRRGTSIAAVGRTGRSTGPHLHYQIEVDGIPVDPTRYIMEDL